nr:MAG TPA: hypothetical protein [Caudoviricetes sp.]
MPLNKYLKALYVQHYFLLPSFFTFYYSLCFPM